MPDYYIIETDEEKEPDKSKGHICFNIQAGRELYARDGQVYIAPIANCIDTEGYRCGRWECGVSAFDNPSTQELFTQRGYSLIGEK